MLVRDLMATDVVSVDREATLAEAARAMLEADAGSTIVTNDGTPTGIVTKTDALLAGSAAERTFDEIEVAEVMSSPLETVQPDATVRAAVDRMTAAGVTKLPVLEGLSLKGIVTMTDVVTSYPDIIREVHELEGRREEWESEFLDEGTDPSQRRRED